MSKLCEWIKEVNWDDSIVRNEYILTCDIEELFNLIEYIRKLINEDYVAPEYSPYSFVPNNELSGTGGCSEINCKVRRASKFATFSAIYADYVYLQLNLITDEHFDMWNPSTMDKADIYAFKYAFNCDISVILAYLPLIEYGIAIIEPVRKLFCKECFQRKLLNRNDLVDYSAITQHVKENVIIELGKYSNRDKYATVELKNINNYFDGENLLYTLSRENLDKLNKYDRKPGIKSVKSPYWNKIIEEFVENEFVSSCYYTNYCRENNAKLITSKPSDAMFASITRSKDSAKNILETFKNLPQYEMPYIQQLSIENALHLREIEHEAFNNYRIALDKAVKEQCSTNEKIEWKDIYDDILYPEYAKLDMKLRNLSSGVYSKTFSNMVVLLGTITGGVLSGVITKTPQTIVGGALASGAAAEVITQAMTKRNFEKVELRQNDYYYLWRLRNM